jgi:hypothetical protein
MKREKLLLLSILGLIILFSIGCIIHQYKTQILFNYNKYCYGQSHLIKNIKSRKEIDSILNILHEVKYDQLDHEYKNYTLLNSHNYLSLVKGKSFYKVQGEDIFKPIIGTFRIADFLPKDVYFEKNIAALPSGKSQYWLIDKQLLYILLTLQDSLRSHQYNPQGFKINYSYRYPLLNQKVKGANKSQHLLGKAVDIHIQDINQDGKSDQIDKAIVYDLLNKHILFRTGGLGRYPNTMVIHLDVRPWKARWDYRIN